MPVLNFSLEGLQSVAAPRRSHRHGAGSRLPNTQPAFTATVGTRSVQCQIARNSFQVASSVAEASTRTPDSAASQYAEGTSSGRVFKPAGKSFNHVLDLHARQASYNLGQALLSPLQEPALEAEALHRQIENSRSWEAVLHLVEGSITYICPRNTTKALGMLAKMSKEATKEQTVACVRDVRFGLLIRLANKHLTSMKPKHLANSFYSFAALKVALPAPLLNAYVAQTQAQLKDLNLADVAMMMYGFAVIKHNPGSETLAQLARRAQVLIPKASRVTAQDLTMLVWSCATLQYNDAPAKTLVDIVLKQLPAGFSGFVPQGVANVMWALTKLGRATPLLLQDTVKYMEQNIHRFKPLELTTLLWALAVNRHHPEALLETVLVEAAAQAELLKGEDLVRLFYAMATFSHLPEPAALERLTVRAEQLLGAIKPQELCCMLWSLALAGLASTPLFKDIGEMLPELYSRNALDDLDLRQACQAHIKAGISGVHLRFPKPMMDAMRTAFVAEVNNVPVSSVLAVLSSTLKQLRMPHQCRVPTRDGLCMVDIAFKTSNGRRIALQVVQPTDCSANTGQFLGPLRFQRDVLEGAGWEVKFLQAQQFSNISSRLVPAFVAELVRGLGYNGPLDVDAAVAAQNVWRQRKQNGAVPEPAGARQRSSRGRVEEDGEGDGDSGEPDLFSDLVSGDALASRGGQSARVSRARPAHAARRVVNRRAPAGRQ